MNNFKIKALLPGTRVVFTDDYRLDQTFFGTSSIPVSGIPLVETDNVIDHEVVTETGNERIFVHILAMVNDSNYHSIISDSTRNGIPSSGNLP